MPGHSADKRSNLRQATNSPDGSSPNIARQGNAETTNSLAKCRRKSSAANHSLRISRTRSALAHSAEELSDYFSMSAIVGMLIAKDPPMVIITWNVVFKNFHGSEPLINHLREQVTQLEEYLSSCPADSVHLLVELARDLKSDTYTASLSLRLSDKFLRAQHADKAVKQAFDQAVTELGNQLKSQAGGTCKQGNARFADKPMAEGTGPQSYNDLVRRRQEVHR